MTDQLRWHYGPTDADPDPAQMWCYADGGAVLEEDALRWCSVCGLEEKVDLGEVSDG